MKKFTLKLYSIFVQKTRYTKLPVALILIVLAFSVSTVAAQDFYPLERKTFVGKQDELDVIYKFKKNGDFEYILKAKKGIVSFSSSFLGTYNQTQDYLSFEITDAKIKLNGIDLTKYVENPEKQEAAMEAIQEDIGGKYKVEDGYLIFLRENGEPYSHMYFKQK